MTVVTFYIGKRRLDFLLSLILLISGTFYIIFVFGWPEISPIFAIYLVKSAAATSKTTLFHPGP